MKKYIPAAIIGVILLILLSMCFAIVNAGSVGVVTRFGAVQRVVNPGIYLKIPFAESVVMMETRVQKEQVDAQAASSDLQIVKSTIALNFHLNGEKAIDVYQNLGPEYTERIIAPAMQEAFKASTATFSASDLIKNREAVKALAYEQLKSRFEKYNIIVDDFNIVNFDFSPEFNSAIEDKTVAAQNQERSSIEADTLLIQAQGQSKAQAELKNSGALSAEYLQFLAVQKWNGILPTATSGVPFVNIPVKQ